LGTGIGAGAGALFGDDALNGAAKGALIGGSIGLGAGAGAGLGSRLAENAIIKQIVEGRKSSISPRLKHTLYTLLGAAPVGVLGGIAGSRIYDSATD